MPAGLWRAAGIAVPAPRMTTCIRNFGFWILDFGFLIPRPPNPKSKIENLKYARISFGEGGGHEVGRDRVALPGRLDVEDAVDAELAHVATEVAVALEVGLADVVDVHAAHPARRLAARAALREVVDLDLEPLAERLGEHLRDGAQLPLALRPEDGDLELLRAEAAHREEPAVLLAVLVHLLGELHVVEAVLRDEVEAALLEPFQRVQPAARLALPQRGLGDAVQAEPVAEVLHDLLHDVEEGQRGHGVRQVRLEHRHVEAADVEADDELRLLQARGERSEEHTSELQSQFHL